jgi:hypothetical protein
MNQLQIDSLRDLAIEYLPRAQTDREQIKKVGGTFADFYRRLAFTSVMVRSNAGITAVEYAAANLLESISLLYIEQDEPLSKRAQADILSRLARDAKELCALTGRVISWLDALPAPPDTAPEPEPEIPSSRIPRHSIAGRMLTTKEAAEVLGYAEQTLRMWASKESGPLRPKRPTKKLLWSGDEILSLLSCK